MSTSINLFAFNTCLTPAPLEWNWLAESEYFDKSDSCIVSKNKGLVSIRKSV